jgi:ABC-type transporter Mla subunit MlaD
MRRLAAIVVAVLASVALLVAGTAAGGDEGVYEVRAIFDNAGFLVKGEEVRVAGAKVGSVAEVDVTGVDEVASEDGGTAPGKAVVVMRIDDPGFQDFREDASCLIRPQSLIGEKFVECSPTEPRAADSPEAPPLEQIPDGEPGEGQYLLPVERNGKAIDLDLVNNIMKEPYPDRFRLILNNLGASFAARGEELAEIVERGNPALRETNELLETLARQNRTLAQLSSDSDRVISALASERDSISGFINESQVAAEATAERSDDLEESFVRFPGFLRELESTMVELESFSQAATPVFSDLGDAAPSLTRATKALGPFANAGIGALDSLGNAADEAGPAIADSDPVIRQVRGLAKSGKPATTNLAKFLSSWREADGFQNLMELVYNLSGSVNAFDQFGHFQRALLPVNNCVDYEIIPEPTCGADFDQAVTASAKQKLLARAISQARRQAAAGNGSLERGSASGEEPTIEVDPGSGDAADGGFGDALEGLGDLIPGEAEGVPEDGAEPETETAPAPSMRATRDLLDFLMGEPQGGGGR